VVDKREEEGAAERAKEPENTCPFRGQGGKSLPAKTPNGRRQQIRATITRAIHTLRRILTGRRQRRTSFTRVTIDVEDDDRRRDSMQRWFLQRSLANRPATPTPACFASVNRENGRHRWKQETKCDNHLVATALRSAHDGLLQRVDHLLQKLVANASDALVLRDGEELRQVRVAHVRRVGVAVLVLDPFTSQMDTRHKTPKSLSVTVMLQERIRNVVDTHPLVVSDCPVPVYLACKCATCDAIV
jgi:hypothetical protein